MIISDIDFSSERDALPTFETSENDPEEGSSNVSLEGTSSDMCTSATYVRKSSAPQKKYVHKVKFSYARDEHRDYLMDDPLVKHFIE